MILARPGYEKLGRFFPDDNIHSCRAEIQKKNSLSCNFCGLLREKCLVFRKRGAEIIRKISYLALKEKHHRGTIMNSTDFIIRDPQICGGQPVIKGTRVTLKTMLASLAEGARIEEILQDFPTLTKKMYAPSSHLLLFLPRKICRCQVYRCSHEDQTR